MSSPNLNLVLLSISSCQHAKQVALPLVFIHHFGRQVTFVLAVLSYVHAVCTQTGAGGIGLSLLASHVP